MPGVIEKLEEIRYRVYTKVEAKRPRILIKGALPLPDILGKIKKVRDRSPIASRISRELRLTSYGTERIENRRKILSETPT
ncbi:MAG: hypothetical protein DRO40_13630 [Thermoprotei archaeon]|nr:MAG: hypothetical protein DRO40_13630 [Thermoprotei archaeon]